MVCSVTFYKVTTKLQQVTKLFKLIVRLQKLQEVTNKVTLKVMLYKGCREL